MFEEKINERELPEEKINECRLSMFDLIDKFKDELSPEYIVCLLIENAVRISLFCALTELEGVKLVLDCVKIGITTYEEKES